MNFVDSVKSNETMSEGLSPGMHPNSWCAASDELLILILKARNIGCEPVIGNNGSITLPPGQYKRPDNFFKVLLSDIKSKPFAIFYQKKIPTLEELKKQIFLEPYLMKDLTDPKIKAHIIRRAIHDNASGDFINHENQLLCLRLASRMSTSNPFLSYLKYYVEQADKLIIPVKGGVEPVHDALSGTRLLVLLNFIYWYEVFGHIIDFKVLEEVFFFMFHDPFQRTRELKSMINTHRRCAFCRFSGGTRAFYGAFVDGVRIQNLDHPIFYDLKDEPKDEEFYQTQLGELTLRSADMIANGLVRLERLLTELISAEVNDRNLSILTVLFSLEGLSGYTRGYAPEAHERQSSVELPVGNLGYSEFLKKNWKDFFRYAESKNLFPRYDEYRSRIPSIQTGNSAGGSKVSFSVKTVKKQSSIRAQSRISDRINLRFTSKRFDFLSRGVELLSPKVIFTPYRAEFDEKGRYIGGSAGAVGTREVVGGKYPRGIYMRRTEHFIAEALFFFPLMEYQTRDQTDFSISQMFGIPQIDHSSLFKASSIANLFIDDSDFSVFDTSQKERNMRSIARKALREAVNESRYKDVPFGPFKDVFEALERIWGPGITQNAEYVTKSGDDLRVLVLDLLQSGEYMTLLINNMTNKSNDDYTMAKLRSSSTKFSDYMRLILRSFMGDDYQAIYRVSDNFNSVIHRKFLEEKSAAAADNELDLNVLKTGFRRWMGEYLKVRCAFGYAIPLLLIQLLSSERVTPNVFPTEMMRGELAKYAVIAGRGVNDKFLWRYGLHKWNIRRGIRFFPEKGKAWYYLPYASIFTPGRYGGGGQHPCTLFGSSKDTIIAYDLLTRKDPEYRGLYERVQKSIGILKARNSKSLREFIASAAASGRVDPPDVFMPGKSFIEGTQLKERKKRAAALASKFPSFREYNYNFSAERMIREDVRGDSQNVALDEQAKLGSVPKFQLAESLSQTGDLDDFKWMIRSFTIVSNETLKPLTESCVYPIYEGNVRRAAMIYGSVSARDIADLSASKLFSPLKKDPHWRRDISDEELARILMSPQFLIDREKIANFLVFCGATESAANQVANNVTEKAETYALTDNAVNFSIKGSALTHGFQMDVAGLRRVVDCASLSDSNVIHNIISTIAFMHRS